MEKICCQNSTGIKVGVCIIFAIIAVGCLYILNDFERVALTSTEGQTYEKGEVTSIIKDNLAEDGQRYGDQEVVVKIKSGALKGQEVSATSPNGTLFGANCTPGMNVICMVSISGDTNVVTIYSKDRSLAILSFILLFILIVSLIGGKKGVKAVVSLVVTFIAIFYGMFPMIYKGFSPVGVAIIVCIFSTFVTLGMLGGVTRKTASAIIGTTVGVTTAGVSATLFGKIAGISGYNVSEIETLSYVAQYCSISIGELLFAGIIISSLGAVMDVGMSIASTIQEIHETDLSLSRKQLFVSGIHVGRDMMGTMTNTLILAYVGGGLTTLIINYAYHLPANQLLHSYSIGIEIMQGFSGSLGVVLTVPVTAFLSSFLLTNKSKYKKK